MTNKEKFIKFIKENYHGSSQKLMLEQVDLFFTPTNIVKTKYNVGESVHLKKGTYLHGVPKDLESLDWVFENGFIGNNLTNKTTNNKIKGSIGMWVIQEDISLQDYIKQYSGFTITYKIVTEDKIEEISQLVPYHQFDEYTERINNDERIWTYSGEQTKEVRFMPSLVSNKRQLAFILNMESNYAKTLIKNDVWNNKFSEETIKPFIDYRYYDKFIEERNSRTALTTNREAAIMFGLPSCLIEGIFVGRRIENDTNTLSYIKEKFKDCYICNLDGKVIVGNK